MKPLPAAIYTDGGLIGPNPSRLGGTWAYVWVDDHGKVLSAKSGIITPKEMETKTVTNNQTELLAMTLALESVPKDWSGMVFTDSLITKNRILYAKSFKGIPRWLEARVRWARKNRPKKIVLVGGHPTKKQLENGQRANGTLVSKFNVMCDKRCRELAAKFRLTSGCCLGKKVRRKGKRN